MFCQRPFAPGIAGGSPRKLIDRKRFEEGLDELVRILQPHTILVYGSANYPCFDKLIDQGIEVIAYPGSTASAFDNQQNRIELFLQLFLPEK